MRRQKLNIKNQKTGKAKAEARIEELYREILRERKQEEDE